MNPKCRTTEITQAKRWIVETCVFNRQGYLSFIPFPIAYVAIEPNWANWMCFVQDTVTKGGGMDRLLMVSYSEYDIVLSMVSEYETTSNYD